MSETNLGMLSAAVTDLSARVEALDAQIAAGGHESTAQLHGRLAAVEAVLADLRTAVSTLAQNKQASDTQTQLRRPWHQLSDEQAEKRWQALRAWVDWFIVRDNIGSKEIPDCWYLHGGLVDELEALRWAWLESTTAESKMTEAIWWREVLHRARTRWPSFNPNGCSTTHTQTRPRPLGRDHEWRNFLAQELANHPTQRTTRVS